MDNDGLASLFATFDGYVVALNVVFTLVFGFVGCMLVRCSSVMRRRKDEGRREALCACGAVDYTFPQGSEANTRENA